MPQKRYSSFYYNKVDNTGSNLRATNHKYVARYIDFDRNRKIGNKLYRATIARTHVFDTENEAQNHINNEIRNPSNPLKRIPDDIKLQQHSVRGGFLHKVGVTIAHYRNGVEDYNNPDPTGMVGRNDYVTDHMKWGL